MLPSIEPLKARALIIDDEFPVRYTLSNMLAELPMIELVGEAGNVTEGLVLIEQEKPDLLFLDIKMPIRSGFELLDELASKNQSCGIVFVSGYPDEGVEAVQRAAPFLHSDFVIKPINPFILTEKIRLFYGKWKLLQDQQTQLNEQLAEALAQNEQLLEALAQQIDYPQLSTPQFLVFQSISLFHRIEVADIMYCESADRRINIYCSKQDHLNVPNVTLEILARNLPTDHFIRIGKSHILNKNAVTYLEKGPKAKCRLMLGTCTRELSIYTTNIEKIKQHYGNECLSVL